MTTPATGPGRRISAKLRESDRVTFLELFFDLVFVLAVTQCTTFMVRNPTWGGLAKGTLILGVVWWAWVGYAWLTSVVDPEEGIVRIAIFVAMAGVIVAALCIPDTFGDLGLTFAVAYGVVRVGQLALFHVASCDTPELRRSIWAGLVPSTAIGIGLLIVAHFTSGSLQVSLWASALTLDVLGPYLFGSTGWQLAPHHFAERHALVFIIALGESIVAIAVGAEAGVDAGVITAAVFATALAATMWWAYFDVVALVAERRLAGLPAGREQNEMARDSYSLLHFPMVAGVVLIASGLHETFAHVDETLHQETAFALVGGLAIYLLAHVAFRWRNLRSVNTQRIVLAVGLIAFVPLADEPRALITLGIIASLMVALISYESIRFAQGRHQVRHAEGENAPS